MKVNFRKGAISDLPTINQIYNQAVAKKFQTADLLPIDMTERRRWFDAHDVDRYIVHVLEIDNQVIGWSSLSKYRHGREALKLTAEVSYYIESNYQGLGHGNFLLEQTIEIAKKVGFENLVAILLSSNDISIRLLSKFNFQEWGRIHDAAIIENQNFDHLYYGRKIT